jgi:hypothetical protein
VDILRGRKNVMLCTVYVGDVDVLKIRIDIMLCVCVGGRVYIEFT